MWTNDMNDSIGSARILLDLETDNLRAWRNLKRFADRHGLHPLARVCQVQILKFGCECTVPDGARVHVPRARMDRRPSRQRSDSSVIGARREEFIGRIQRRWSITITSAECKQ